jgi:hypothetical protein
LELPNPGAPGFTGPAKPLCHFSEMAFFFKKTAPTLPGNRLLPIGSRLRIVTPM